MRGEEFKIVCLKILGGFGCALAILLPFVALFTVCCVVVLQTAEDVADEMGPAIVKGLEEKMKRVALDKLRAEAPALQSLFLVKSIAAGASVPGPCAVFAIGLIDSYERSLQQIKKKSDPVDPEFVVKALSAFSLLALFGEEPVPLPPSHDKR